MKTTGLVAIKADAPLAQKKMPERDGEFIISECMDALRLFLRDARVVMGDGSVSNAICVLCANRMIPGQGSADGCACQAARKILSNGSQSV